MEDTGMNWRKATYSNGGVSNCVEVGNNHRAVIVRDTKQRHMSDATRTAVAFPAEAWAAFTRSLKM